MKKITVLAVFMLFLFISVGLGIGMPSKVSTEKTPVNRGRFQAEMGIREGGEPIIELEGVFREARRGYVVFGTVGLVDSGRSTRFQGFFVRNQFIIQSAVRNNIVNIIGGFRTYNEDRGIYQGHWQGFVVGHGRTSGWITAQFI